MPRAKAQAILHVNTMCSEFVRILQALAAMAELACLEDPFKKEELIERTVRLGINR